MTTKVLIGTPCYGGNLSVNYFHAMRRLLPMLEKQGIEVFLKTLAQESLISRGRNTIVAEFLGRQDFTHLLFIDADIGFEPETILRLLARNQPVVGAACPMKGYAWDKVLTIAKKTDSVDALKRASLQFAINPHDEDNTGSVAIDDGFMRVSKCGTGMMLIQRPVLERLREVFPDLKYTNDVAGYENEFTRDNFWTFFEPMLHPKTRRYLSEDYAFCHRWTQGCQGEIWVDVQSRISHYGQAAFAGSFMDMVQGQQ
jgi:hypothetical protein